MNDQYEDYQHLLEHVKRRDKKTRRPKHVSHSHETQYSINVNNLHDRDEVVKFLNLLARVGILHKSGSTYYIL